MGRQEVGLGGGRGAGQGHCSPSVGRGQDQPVKWDPPVPELRHGQDQALFTCEVSVPNAPTFTRW